MLLLPFAFIAHGSRSFGMKNLKKLVAPVVICSGIIMNPVDVDAAYSGGRSGGSSFRAPSPSRSMPSSPRPSTTRLSASPRSSYSYSTSLPIIHVAPYYSTPTSTSAPAITPSATDNDTLLNLAAASFTLILSACLTIILTDGIGPFMVDLSSRLSYTKDSAVLDKGVSVVKLQICLDSSWDYGNIQDALSGIASTNSSPKSRPEMSDLLFDASIALLCHSADWEAVAYEGKKFGAKSEADPFYQKLAVVERTKFEVEANGKENILSSIIRSRNAGFLRSDAGRSVRTKAVVSILCAISGKSSTVTNGVVRSVADTRNALKKLASYALVDEGENVMAVEVLWTPSEKNTVVTERDMIEDYPELIKL